MDSAQNDAKIEIINHREIHKENSPTIIEIEGDFESDKNTEDIR